MNPENFRLSYLTNARQNPKRQASQRQSQISQQFQRRSQIAQTFRRRSQMPQAPQLPTSQISETSQQQNQMPQGSQLPPYQTIGGQNQMTQASQLQPQMYPLQPSSSSTGHPSSYSLQGGDTCNPQGRDGLTTDSNVRGPDSVVKYMYRQSGVLAKSSNVRGPNSVVKDKYLQSGVAKSSDVRERSSLMNEMYGSQVWVNPGTASDGPGYSSPVERTYRTSNYLQKNSDVDRWDAESYVQALGQDNPGTSNDVPGHRTLAKRAYNSPAKGNPGK